MATKKHSKLKAFLESHFIEFKQDGDRLKALYSDFSKLSLLNKYAYDTNVGFWRRVLLDCNQQGFLGVQDYTCVIQRESIAEKFQRPEIGRPLALDCVLDVMEKEGEIVQLDEFNTKYAPSPSWMNWIYDTVVQNTWQWRWRNDTLVAPKRYYVVLPTLKHISQIILNHHYQHNQKPTDHILTLTQFKTLYAQHNEAELTDLDIELVLKYLCRTEGIAITNNIKGYGTTYQVIKFPAAQGQIATITQHDEAIISIRTTCHALSIQVDQLQEQSEQLVQQSKREKSLGHTSMALYCLKRRKNLLDVLEKRLKSMETMDHVLMKIETSHDDMQIIEAFNLGAETLKEILGQDGLTLESVDETMEKMQWALQDQKEIEDAIHLGQSDMNNDVDEQVEEELAELVAEEARISSPPPKENLQKVESELARLNQMFASVKQPTTSFVKQKELAS